MCTQYKGECSLGCKQGYYGNRCLSQCPINCLDCSSAEKCGTCELGYYGAYCQFSCSDGCAENYCHKQYGTCSPCVKSKTGKYCTANCSEGCLYESCNQNDGKCTHGCKQGFYGLTTCENHCPNKCVTCSSAKLCLTCANGYYGSRCGSQCPDTCQTCDEHGICLTCKVNYFDPDKKCQCLQGLCESIPCVACSNSTYYANEHSNTCCPCSSQCKHSLCSSAELCTHGCENGYFGTGCENVCSIRDQMCTICNENTLNTFVCTTCIDRFYPNSNRTCIPCSANCFEGNCNNSTGHCANGCKDGFWNFKCENTCLENCSVCDQDSGKCLICSTSSLHGIKCENTCNSKCTNKSCYMNGNCKSGCLSNYYGPSCDTQCPINCAQNGSESRCSSETGICMYGCNAGFTGGNCMADLKQGSSLDSIFAAAIGGGFAAVFIVVIVIVIGLVTFKRRKTRHPKTAIVRETSYDAAISVAPVYASVVRHHIAGAVSVNTSSVKETSFGNVTNPVYTNILSDEHLAMANVTSEDSLEVDELDSFARQNAIRFEENGGVYYNNANEVKKFKTPVAELQKYVMSKDRHFFKTEFEKFPYGLLKDFQVSQIKANITKNRYKGIYPYDAHRVKVLGEDTDYINASFIDGYNKRHEYIAALGPMSKQLGDFRAFWKMVWQQKVEKIVMVTNLVEERTVKCEQYWPDASVSQVYGDIRVVCQSENHYAEFTRRTFTVMKSNEERILHHLHFTAWPDKDVPEDVTSIIEFREKILHAPVVLGGPTIVHCSAGVGRTGTYIAIDTVTKEGESEGAVDIAGCVLNMRQNRPNMVQTAGQYEYIHHAVVHSLTFDCKHVAGEKFQSYMNNVSKEQIRNIFHTLQETKTHVSLEGMEAVERNTNFTDKNRKGPDIPGDVHRPRLYLNHRPGASDYINAVFVNSFQVKNKYILAQSPLPNTVAEFLSLVVQTDCACIVNFESTSATRNDVGVYVPPDNKVLKKGIFNVRCSKADANAYRIKRTLTIDYHGKELCLTHLEFTDWNKDQNLPNSPSDFRRLITEVDIVTATANADRPVLIHCLDGASKCALFSVVASLLQTMEVEHEVSIVNAVRKVRTRRKGAIPNSEQFQFCHDCVLDYIKSPNAYSKFIAEI